MRIRLALLLLGIVCLSLLAVPQASIFADEWLPIDPADLKMTGESKAPGAPAIFLYRQVDRKDLPRGGVEQNYVRIKILTEEGRQYGNIVIPVETQTHVSNIRARTVHADGSIVNFEGKVFDKVIEKTKGTKFQAKVFTAPDVQVGSIVEYHFTYDLDDGYIFGSYWPVSDYLFTRKAVFSLVPFKEWALRWQWPAGLPTGTEPPKQDPLGVVRMTSTDIPAFETEDFMPPENELKFRVLFIYDEGGFEQNPDKYWRKFGKKENDRMEGFVGKKKDLEPAVSQIVSPGDAPEVKLKKIYTRLEEVRNLSYEPRKTEQEEKRDKPKIDHAADVLKNGYGTGYEITWTFLGLARAAGLEAYGAMMSRRNEYFFNAKRMDRKELDSNVVLVKINGKDLFFDPGSRFVPYGFLPWEETAVKGLRLDGEGGSWVDTPFPESGSSQILRSANFKISEQGDLEGTVKLSYTGLESWSRRLAERNEDEEARKKYLEEELQAYVPAAAEVELTNKPDWKGTENPLTAEFSVKIPGWISSAGHRALLPVGVFAASEKRVFDHANRVYPIIFHFPYVKKDEITVELPSGWTVSSVPAAMDKDAKAAQYTMVVKDNKNELQVTRTLRSDLFMIPKESYPALRGFYQLVRSGDDQQVVLQPGAAAAAQ